MCEKCRRDKKKCTPEYRDWEGRRQKCERCIELDRPCSEAKSSATKLIQQAETGDEGNYHSLNNGTEHRTNRTKHRGATSQLNEPLLLDTHPHSSNDILQAASRSSNCPPSKHQAEIYGQKILKCLGDDLGTYKILLWYLQYIQEVETTFESSSVQHTTSKAVKCVLDGVMRSFDSHTSAIDSHLLAQAWFCTGYQFVKAKISLAAYEASNNLYTMHTRKHNYRDTVARNSSYKDHQKRQFYSDAEHLCEDLSPATDLMSMQPTGISNPSIQAYKNAEKDVREIFTATVKSMPPEDCDYTRFFLHNAQVNPRENFHAFPALIMAYIRNDRRLALQMFEDADDAVMEVDILRRTLLHHIVNSGDINSLRELAKFDASAIQCAGQDVFGLSLLAISAMRGDQSMFEFLLQQNANYFTNDIAGRTVLDIAARSNSRVLVEFILRQNQFLPLPLSALQHAVQGGREMIAKTILPYCKDISCYNKANLVEIATLASSYGMPNLARDINELSFITEMDQQQAVASLGQARVDIAAGCWSISPTDTPAVPVTNHTYFNLQSHAGFEAQYTLATAEDYLTSFEDASTSLDAPQTPSSQSNVVGWDHFS